MTYYPSRVPDCLVALLAAAVIVALAAPARPAMVLITFINLLREDA